MGATVQRRPSRRNLPLEALQLLAELGVGLDDAAALRRVKEGLQGGLPKCCIAFARSTAGLWTPGGRTW